MKKFELGLSTMLTIDEHKNILHKYRDNLDYVYFSVPLGMHYQTRNRIYDGMTQEEGKEYLKQCIKIIKENGLKTELCLNQYYLSKNDIILACEFMKNEIECIPDAIVLLDEYYNYTKEFFQESRYFYSFNNHKRWINQVKDIPLYYDEYVDIKMPNLEDELKKWNYLKEYFDIRMMLNNCCAPNCASCKSGMCDVTANNNLKKYGINKMVAMQTVFPSEVHQVYENLDVIKSYKLSTRLANYKEIYNGFDAYISGDDEKALYRGNGTLKLVSLVNAMKENEINIDEIYNLKKKYWNGMYNPDNISSKSLGFRY